MISISGNQLSWPANPDHRELVVELQAITAQLLARLPRLQCQIVADDKSSMLALHRVGYRQEGRLRKAGDNGQDLLVYGLLADDPIDDRLRFSSVMESVLAKHRVIGHVLFTNQAGEVLLVQPSYKTDWELPGGIVEPNETPRIGAQREVFEELGIQVALDQPLVVDWMPPYLGWSAAIEFIFDGGVLDQETISNIEYADREIISGHFVAPDELDQVVTPLSARRIRRLLAQPSKLYTEDSYEPRTRPWPNSDAPF